MKKWFTMMALALCALTLTACGGGAPAKSSGSSAPAPKSETPAKKEDAKTDGKRALVVYFSRADENYNVGYIEKGNTHILAETPAAAAQASVSASEPAGPLLVNRSHPLPDGYASGVSLVTAANCFGEEFQIERETYAHFLELRANLLRPDATTEGAIQIEIAGAYRNAGEQRAHIEALRAAEKWLRPAPQEFNIRYEYEGTSHQYQPDFVAETEDARYLIEVKAANMLEDAQVLAKKARGVEYCRVASEWAKEAKSKPWRYVLIPDTAIHSNASFGILAGQFRC